MSNLVDLVKKMAGQSTEKVDEKTRRERLRECDGCPNLKFGTNCRICFCFVSEKVLYKDEQCPDGRWKRQD